VEKGEVIALYDGQLVSSAPTIEEAIEKLLEKASMDEVERVTFFYGEDLNQTQANLLADGVREEYPEVEIEIHSGGQPHYQLIIAFE
jgi:dihydroxyacetone kinase-like predicted kinase